MEANKNRGEKTKIRVGGANRVSLAFTDEMLDENAEIDLMGGIDDQPQMESAAAFNRRKSTVRRRSSIGMGHKPSGSLLDDEQNANLAEMYKTVIQLSTEGKLNEKNSWKYNLIDHMGKLIRDETKGVNFQKASCTLDASVKIYSNRVDDTYSTSHRVLESLSRNNNEIDANILGEETVPHRVKPVKVGTKSSSTRLNIAQTIEKNPEAINAVKLEHDYAFDPMFHKISKAFDEGGSKGMLLYNMRLSSKSSALSFIGKGVEQRWNAAEDETVKQQQSSTGSFINMRELVGRSKITLDSILNHQVCPKLSEYRRFVNINSSNVGVIDTEEIKEAVSKSAPPLLPPTIFSSSPPPYMSTKMQSEVEVADVDVGGDDGAFFPNDDGDYYPNDDGGLYHEDGADASSVATGVQARASVSGVAMPAVETTKIQWETPSDAAKKEIAKQLVEALPISTNNDTAKNDYSFFISTVDDNDDNSWAGAPHWKKLRPRKKPAQQANNDTSSISDVSSIGSELNPKAQKATPAKSRKTTAKKDLLKNGGFELTLELVDSSKFGAPSSRSKVDTTVMTKVAREKAIASAPSLLLPPDEHLKVHDLCRLFLLPSVIVPPKKISNLIKGSAAAANSKKNNGSVGANSRPKALLGNIRAGEEQVWGKDEKGLSIIPSTYTTSSAPVAAVDSIADENENDIDPIYNDDDGHYDIGDYGGGDDGQQYTSIPISIQDGMEDVDKSPSNGNLLGGLSINQDKLVQASRVVEKIDINYAKVSKRVDVHKLKGDVWNSIENKLGDHEAAKLLKEKAQSKGAAPQLSFQKLVKELSGGQEKQQQKDVSLAYYFICLLHLANENTLEICGQDDMGDLKIKYDK